MTNDLSTLSIEHRELKFINKLTSLTQKECYRPRLLHLKAFLKQEISFLEQRAKEVFVISGTNGKGETAHCLKYLLEQKGHRVALWTSPHVLSVRERIYLNGENISYDQLDELIETFKNVPADESLSFYEFLFFLFIKFLKASPPDFIILEVGLGGRFDGVNVFSNPICGITSISLDHTQILGNTLEQILFEKYGITRIKGQLLSAIEQGSLVSLLEKWARRDGIAFEQLSFTGVELYFERNQELATRLFLKAGEELPLEICWPESKGRREKMTINGRNLIFIGAHNLDGHRKMLNYLYSKRGESEVCDSVSRSTDLVALVSFSTGREEQIESILKLYNSYPYLFSDVFITNFTGDRALSRDKLEELLLDDSIIELNWKRFLSEEFENKTILITGSYFFIAKFQEFLLAHCS